MTIVADPAIYQGNITVFLNFIKWNMKIECKQQGRRNGRFSGEEQKIFFKEDDDEETANTRLELPLICCDNNTISTTEYLTSKLVEDSLKWQNESKACGSSLLPSPRDSPMAAKKIRPQNISDDIKRLSIKPKKMDVLDPTAIDDIEKHARYLAACVDSMVENL